MMREILSYGNGMVRIVRRGLWYRVLRGSVVVSTHWTKCAALDAAVAVDIREPGGE